MAPGWSTQHLPALDKAMVSDAVGANSRNILIMLDDSIKFSYIYWHQIAVGANYNNFATFHFG